MMKWLGELFCGVGKALNGKCEDATMFEDEIARLRKQLAPPLPPAVRGEISYADLYSLLIGKFPSAAIFISDNTQYLCDIDDINAFLTQDETNRIEYTGEAGFDCDDFAYRLQGQFSIPGWSGIAIGIIWTEKHALNVFIDANQELWYIEPQSDSVQSKLEEWQGSQVRIIII